MNFDTASVSRSGGRDSNQDSFGSHQQNGLYCWVVADGLGGHRGGEVASRIAVDEILAAFRRAPALSGAAIVKYLQGAQAAILEHQRKDPALSEMRTTVVVLISDGRQALWGHIGDSRLYHFERGRVIAQTEDHSVPQAMAAAGDIRKEDIRHHEDRNRLLRSIGKEGELKPALLPSPAILHRGDAFLLCTDGFWEYVDETEMELDLAKSSSAEQWLSRLEVRLVGRAPVGNDNYTAMGMMYTAAGAPEALPSTHRDRPAARSHGGSGTRIATALLGAFMILAAVVAWKQPWVVKPKPGVATAEPITRTTVPQKIVYLSAQKTRFTDLQSAIDKATAKDEIWIGPGTWEQSLKPVSKSVSLIGSGRDKTHIHLLKGNLTLNGVTGGIEDLDLFDSHGSDSVLRLGPEFHGFVRNNRVQGQGKSLIDLANKAQPVIEGNLMEAVGAAHCLTRDGKPDQKELGVSNQCVEAAAGGGQKAAKPGSDTGFKPAPLEKP